MMFISYSGWRSKTRWWPHALMLGVVILLAASNIAMRWTALMGEVSEDIDAMMSGEGYPLPLVTDALPKFGYLSLAVFAIGVWFLSAKGMVKSYAVLSYAILFLVILSLFSHFSFLVYSFFFSFLYSRFSFPFLVYRLSFLVYFFLFVVSFFLVPFSRFSFLVSFSRFFFFFLVSRFFFLVSRFFFSFLVSR